jgi:hypothetical protein
MNKFEHLKSKNRTVDDFIEGAQKDSITQNKNKNRNKKVLLAVTGRAKREKYLKSPQQIYLKKSIVEEIDEYCNGSIQSVVNYLIYRGLQAIKEKGEIVIISADDI